MSDNRDIAINYAHQNHSSFIDDLINLVRIPSVSTYPQSKQDMFKAADYLADELRDLGAKNVQIFPTNGHPIIYGELSSGKVDSKTVLVYGHYDVQPPDPLDQWQSPPFEPEQRGDNLFGRGVSDMKGQVVASLKAVESIVKTGTLPINIKFIFEGEEEIGSVNLEKFIQDNKDLLTCQVVLNPDSGMIASDIPTIVYSLRGLAYFELRVYGPLHDLHSGVFGGILYNPAQALCVLVAGMHDQSGRITLPGFYDSVRLLSPEERREMLQLPMDDNYYLAQTGVKTLWGEEGYTPVERVGARPTLEINGLYSGFTGHGSKTVIPSTAMAKISMRLVPDQDPKEVHQQLINYLNQNNLPGIRWELTSLTGGPASITDRTSTETKALGLALESIWGRPPFYKREGGSIPVVSSMQKILGVDSVLTGFGLPDDNIHSPNEKLHLPTWFMGIDSLIHFFFNL